MPQHLSPLSLLFCVSWICVFQCQAVGSTHYHDALYTTGSVYCEKRTCKFEPGTLDFNHAVASGSFNDTLLTAGWGILDIKAQHPQSGEELSDADVLFAAGFLEGVFTATHMEDMYANTIGFFFPNPDDPRKKKVETWLNKQRDWADMMCSQHSADPLWRHTSYMLAQLDGLYAGYKSVRKGAQSLDMSALNFLNAEGDLLDLMSVIDKSSIPDWTKFTPEEAESYFYRNTHCSALIKLLPGLENLYMSHSSWFIYRASNRIYKHYNFDVKDQATAAKKLSFSSYPGFLESLDDFYQLGSGMVMLQTTNNIFNSSLYDKVKPSSLLAWQRVRVANMMARSGEEWTNIFAKYNSGTYNNQYMVIDLKLITPKKPLPENTLWVAEQIPGLVVAQDVTYLLRAGYFPSYNVPFFDSIYNKSGYPGYVKLHGLQYSYQMAPRAEIFRRDASKAVDMDTMKKVMRYNDWSHDPYSGGSAMGAICARGDLDKDRPRPSGCYDTKVADLKMAKAFQADIINGPTLGTSLTPFSWTGQFSGIPHSGLPITYNFTFVRTQPRFW